MNIGYICERTASVHVLPTTTYNRNFTVLLLFLSRISQNWSAPDSIRCFINGEKNYFNKYNRLDIIIFRLEIMFLWLSGRALR